jgi:hypothetical protein
LKEYLLKKKKTSGEASRDPVYASSRVAVESQLTLWLSTVTLDGRTYIGDVGRTKRASAEKAAFAVILSKVEAGDCLMAKMLLAKRLKATVPRRYKTVDCLISKRLRL